jgi:hypothetical protein
MTNLPEAEFGENSWHPDIPRPRPATSHVWQAYLHRVYRIFTEDEQPYLIKTARGIIQSRKNPKCDVDEIPENLRHLLFSYLFICPTNELEQFLVSAKCGPPCSGTD